MGAAASFLDVADIPFNLRERLILGTEIDCDEVSKLVLNFFKVTIHEE